MKYYVRKGYFGHLGIKEISFFKYWWYKLLGYVVYSVNPKKVKVYQLNEYDWWAGYSLESVKKAYIKETGVPEEEAFMDEGEVSDEAMDRFKYWGGEDNLYDYPITFREELQHMIDQGIEFPCFFATTEY